MNKKLLNIIRKLIIAVIVGIGAYMLGSYPWPTPPALSGLAFGLTGISLYFAHCCGKKSE